MKKGIIFIILQYLFLFIFIVSCVKKEENNIDIKDQTILIENDNGKIDDNENIDELYNELISVLNVNGDYKKSIGDNICLIHNEQMHKEKIKIRYGLIEPETDKLEYNEIKKMIEFYKLKKTYFPNSRYSLYGGCVITDEDDFEDYICNECNEEKDNYMNILGL